MNNKLSITAAAISSLFLTACGSGSASSSGSLLPTVVNDPPALLGYFTNWSVYGAKYAPSDIPSSVDKIVYAFFQVGDCDPQNLGTEVSPKCVRGGQVTTTSQYAYTGTQDYKIHSIDPFSDFSSDYTNSTGYVNFGGKSTIARALKTGNKRVLASIGGFSSGVHIRDAIKPANQATFVNSIVAFLQNQEISAQNNTDAAIKNSNKFAGVDIDWEPNGNYWTMTAQDAGKYQLTKTDLDNYLSFLRRLKDALTAAGYDTLKIATSANPEVINNVDQTYGGGYWKAIANLGVGINLMTYDYYAQAWPGTCEYTGFNSALSADPSDPCSRPFSVSDSVSTMAALGVPKKQIGAGAPAYGYAWSLTSANKDLVTKENPYVKLNATNPTDVYNSANTASWTYRSIITNYSYGVPATTNPDSVTENTIWTAINSSAKAVQTYATALVRGTAPAWISYTAPSDAQQLGKWARSEGLGSVMVWSVDGDVQPGDANVSDWYKSSLIYNLYQGLTK